MDSKIEIRDHGICNHIKRDITLSLVGIDLFFVVVEGSANRFGTLQGNLFPPIFLLFSCSFFNDIYRNIVKGDVTLLCLL